MSWLRDKGLGFLERDKLLAQLVDAQDKGRYATNRKGHLTVFVWDKQRGDGDFFLQRTNHWEDLPEWARKELSC